MSVSGFFLNLNICVRKPLGLGVCVFHMQASLSMGKLNQKVTKLGRLAQDTGAEQDLDHASTRET